MRIEEKQFDLEYINTYASQLTVGNGYLGIRGAHEEDYRGQTRGMYVAGVYNRGLGEHTSDLVNLPDVIGAEIRLNGHVFSLETADVLEYARYVDMRTGELVRNLVIDIDGDQFELTTRRIADQQNCHRAAWQVAIKPLTAACQIEVATGIDGQQTNGGVQHLLEQDVRVLNKQSIATLYQTSQSQLEVSIGVKFSKTGVFHAKERQVTASFRERVEAGQSFELEKIIFVNTSYDEGFSFDNSIEELNTADTYDSILENAGKYWQRYWQLHRVLIDSGCEFDQLAIDFAVYHLTIMTPRNDSRFSVGAKGLTGEGYKGHVFWDTEIFILPFFIHTAPQVARNLLTYRFNRLDGAKQKADLNGFEGALFPWESAFTGAEETPAFAALNIKTGKRQTVASAVAEHHIVADIAYAVESYYLATGDEDFMNQMGKELIKETAAFWLSRAVSVSGHYEIHDVIGPDEYTEHVDNNAYTNYLAKHNVELALTYEAGSPAFLNRCQDFIEKIYLPKPNDTGIIPQDDTFLSKPAIDLDKYKQAQGTQGILLDYSRQQVNELQVLKQADLIMLFYLLPELFHQETKKENLFFYEGRTIHDSSLSKAVHAIEALRADELSWGYELFQEACRIDLGGSPHSSDNGLHAASLGAIWLAVMFGFAGIQARGSLLSLAPKLPEEVKQLSCQVMWQDHFIRIKLSDAFIIVSKETDESLPMLIEGEQVDLVKKIVWDRRLKTCVS